MNPFARLTARSKQLCLAAPYFTMAQPIKDAISAGKSVQLLVGLNAATSPDALLELNNVSNLATRYLTHRFHAKIFLFDDAALLGSSNLTDGGLLSNREAVICLDQATDFDTIEEIRELFQELWDAAKVLTPETLNTFRQAYILAQHQSTNSDVIIEKAVGRVEPANIRTESRTKSRERLFLDNLQRQVYEQYRPAFTEVSQILRNHGLQRFDLKEIGDANETNRFLNWARLTHVIGDEAWQSAPHRPPNERREEILRLGAEWVAVADNRVPETYVSWLRIVQNVFGTPGAIETASQDELTNGLMSLHAFSEQYRFVKGGLVNVPDAFWQSNKNDVPKVKQTLSYLIYGRDDFIKRLHDVLYDSRIKLGHFGIFCALELYGTLRPQESPPINGRMAKALRFIGFDVRAT